MSTQKHDLKYLQLSLIKPNCWNAQHQSEETFNRLVDEILDNGFIDPLEVLPCDDGTYLILGGEHRWRAAKVAGETEVPCIILMDEKFKDADVQKFMSVRLNTIKGQLDPKKFLNLYTDLAKKYGKDTMHKLMGFTNEKYMKSLLKSVKDNVKQSLPKELQPKAEELLQEAHTLKDLGNVVQTLYHQNANTEHLGFMVLAFNGQDHIYVKMDKDLKRTVDKLTSYCKTKNKNINSILAPLLKDGVTDLINNLTEECEPKATNDKITVVESGDCPF